MRLVGFTIEMSYTSSGTSHVTLKHNFIFDHVSTFMLNTHVIAVSFSPDPTKTLPQFQHLFPCSLSNLTDTIDVLPRWWLWQSTISNVIVRLQMQKTTKHVPAHVSL